MNQRARIRMTPDEVRAVLAERRTAAVATIGRDGFAHVVAMWYVPTDDALAFWTYGKSQKAVNLRRDPRVTCLVESGDAYGELRGVQIKGRAELVEAEAEVRRWGEAIWARYAGAELNDAVRAMVAAQAPKRVVAVVHPVEVASWDHRKLGGAY